MKNIVLVIGLLFSISIMSQGVKPTFEKQGDLMKATFYHDNGVVRQQGFYQNGKLQGEWVSFDSNGNKLAIAQYTNGVKSGKWFFWKNGILTEVDYNDNNIASVTEWSGKNTVVITE